MTLLMLVQAIPPDALLALAGLMFLLGGLAAVWMVVALRGNK